MQTYTCFDAPLRVFGIPHFEERHTLERLPAELRAAVPSLSSLGERACGARLCFRTDAAEFTLKAKLRRLSPDIGMALFHCQSLQVFIGDRRDPRYAGLAFPHGYDRLEIEGTFKKSAGMEDVTVYLPRNEPVDELILSVPDGARVEAPTPYAGRPVVFYGSSITECGHCTTTANSYIGILSHRLNMDYYNLGFSGSARGELPLADFINSIEMSAFVYDYDHNAPDAAFLEKTHEPFFLRVREAHPELPVLFLTMPREIYDAQNDRRRAIIRKTYENALSRGDRLVWFIDGERYYGDSERFLCSADATHPNDLGFYRMAGVIEPVLREMLGR